MIVKEDQTLTIPLPIPEQGCNWVMFSKEDVAIVERNLVDKEERITIQVGKKGKYLLRFEKKVEWGMEPLDIKLISFEVDK